MGRLFSTMVGIDEEFSRPHSLLTTNHHFFPVNVRIAQILVDSFIEGLFRQIV